jgi:hypothetical protein
VENSALIPLPLSQCSDPLASLTVLFLRLQPGFALTLELPESERYFDDKIDILELAGQAQVGPAEHFRDSSAAPAVRTAG